jgi:hypothetical protein
LLGSIFGILRAVKAPITVSWIVTSCGLVGEYQHFGDTYCLICTTQNTVTDNAMVIASRKMQARHTACMIYIRGIYQ